MNAIAFRRATWGTFAVILLAGGSATAQTVSSHDSGQNSAVPVDVALHADNTMHGILLDRNGSAVAHAPVTLYRDQSAPRTTATDARGRFQFDGARGGVAVLACGHQLSVVRLWAPNSAPPLARPQAVIYCSGVMRGQGCGPGALCGAAGCLSCGGGSGMGPVGYGGYGKAPNAGIFGGLNLPSIHPIQALKNPVTVGVLMIGGAIALPIALHDDDPLRPPAS